MTKIFILWLENQGGEVVGRVAHAKSSDPATLQKFETCTQPSKFRYSGLSGSLEFYQGYTRLKSPVLIASRWLRPSQRTRLLK